MTSAARRVRLEESAPIFEALGDATRLKLVARLCDAGPMSIARLTSGTAMTRQGVTKHLRVLARAGIVRDARRGRERIWDIDARRLAIARRFLEQASQRWDEALGRLRALVEEDQG